MLVQAMAASDVEDGEIAGEVNENYQHCISPPKRHASTREAAAPSAVAALQQQLPGWEDEQEHAERVKRKSKKEKKKEKKDKQKDPDGRTATSATRRAAADAAGSQGQQATYVNVYGSNVSAADLHA
jgi:hypothetical protein